MARHRREFEEIANEAMGSWRRTREEARIRELLKYADDPDYNPNADQETADTDPSTTPPGTDPLVDPE